MNKIGLIDDKDVSRRSFMLKLNLVLEKSFPGWQIIDSKPFQDFETYRQWLLENEICVLIIDERLDEEKLSDGTYVKYFGSDLVKHLRIYFKDLPIFCITNIEITEHLKQSLSYFNLILSRSKFDSEIDNYLNLIIKSGSFFYAEFQRELGRLGELSTKISNGDFNENDINEIQSLQTRLLIPHLTEDLLSRENYIEKLEKQIEEIKSIQKKLLTYKKNK